MEYPCRSLPAGACEAREGAFLQHSVHVRHSYAGAMYRPAAFDIAELHDLHRFISAAGPAHLVTLNHTESGPEIVSSIIPMLLDAHTGEHGSLLGHLARPNSQWRTIDTDVEALAIFTG